MITPPISINTYSQNALRALSIALLAALPLTVSAAEGEEYKWIGQVDGNGNTSLSLGAENTFKSFTVIAGGTPAGGGRGTTEAVILNKQSLTISPGGSVRIENTTSYENLNNNGGLRLQGGSTADLTDLDYVRLVSIGGKHTTNESVAITVRSILNTNRLDISGKTVQIIGDIENSAIFGTGIINIAIDGQNSYWFGSLVFGGANITLSNGATWIYDADNESGVGSLGRLTNLNLNNGIIILDDQKIDEIYSNTLIENDFNSFTLREVTSTEAKHTAASIENLTGTGGTFLVNLNWLTNQGNRTYAQDGTSDFIQIGEVENGSHQFVEFDPTQANLDQMKPGDKLYFASVETGETVFSTNVDGEEENRSDELYSFNYASQSEKDAENGLTYWYLGKSLGSANENTSLLKSAALASYSLATDLDRFNERRGQSRHTERGANGPWVRYQFSSVGLDSAFDMDKHMIQVGYDADVSNSESRKIVGVAFDYTRGDTDIDGISASGDNDRYGLNFYYTVLADCGGYADFNAKVGRIGSDYDAHNSSGESIGADFWQTYYGLSVEFGYKHDFTNRLFVEPQAQMQVMRIEGADFSTDGGVRAHFEDANSLIGRLGVRAGYEFSFAESLPASSIYVVADVLREFKGDTTWRAVGRSTSYAYDENGHETWYDAGIGADLAVNRNTNLWLDTKYVFGGDYENTWSLNAGVRWMF